MTCLYISFYNAAHAAIAIFRDGAKGSHFIFAERHRPEEVVRARRFLIPG